MKIFISLVFIFSLLEDSYSQIPKERLNDVKITELGFLYYINSEFPTFVPVKNQKDSLTIKDFATSKLKVGFQLNWQELAIDTLDKYAINCKIFNYYTKNAYLKIIPVKLSYTILKYSESEKQLRNSVNFDKFQFANRFVSIENVGGISIIVDKLENVSKANQRSASQ
jgi:hypothetical protein